MMPRTEGAKSGRGEWVVVTAAALLVFCIGCKQEPTTSGKESPIFKAGKLANLEEGVVTDRFEKQGAWLIHTKDASGRSIICALDALCPYCENPKSATKWEELDRRFTCPQCQSHFFITGESYSGPAKNSLRRFAIHLGDDGIIRVDRSKTFQQEFDQWRDPNSYLLGP